MAVREFTDREAPRAAFWKQYQAVKEELAGTANVHVLTYYGIGGIGKTSLVKRLMWEMDHRLSGAVYVSLDFGQSVDIRRNLYSMKVKLEEKTKFSFPLLDLGLYVYAGKVGEKADAPEVKQLTDRSPLLRLLLSVAGTIPILSMATSVIDLVDQGSAWLRNYLKMHSDELERIQGMEAEGLYHYLPMLFALDMQENMRKASEPVVFFLDTYEQMVNEISQIGDPLKNDLWIRGENGLIQNIPGALWVITGREKLKWARFNVAWEDALEQHLLGSLSEADSVHFLQSAGVAPRELCLQLYTLTRGTPVFLDLCVDQYLHLLEEGETPCIERFGSNTSDLTERFIRYMGDAQKDHVFFLACLPFWTSELVEEIAETVLPNFSITTYEKTKAYSFVSPSDDGCYRMQQTVREVLAKACPEAIRRRTGAALLRHFQPVVEKQALFTENFAEALLYVAQGLLLCHTDREEILRGYRERLEKPLDELVDAGQFQQAKRVLQVLLTVAEADQTDGFYAAMLYAKSRYARLAGDYTDALEHAQRCWQIYAGLLEADHPDVLKAMGNCAILLDAVGEHRQALEKKTEILEKRRQRLGDDDLLTLWAMHNLAVTMGKLGMHEQAHTLQEQVLNKRRSILGETHPDTVWAMLNLADTLRQLGHYASARAFQEDVQCKRRDRLGEEHPDTLWAMHHLAMTLRDMGDYPASRALLETVRETRCRILRPGHPDTLSCMADLIVVLRHLGNLREAEQMQAEWESLNKRNALDGTNR